MEAHNRRSGNDDSEDSIADEEVGLDHLLRMSTNSLTNLASYGNPMQKAAQKVLTQARQAPASLRRQDSDTAQDTRGLLPPPGFGSGLRYARSDPLTVERLLQSERINEPGPPNRPIRALNMNSSEFVPRERDVYPTVLSKGPGAPLPLTAGPPGHRQFQSSAFNPANTWQKGSPALNNSVNQWQKNFDQPRNIDSFEGGPPRPQQYPPYQPHRPMQPLNQQPTAPYPSRPTSTLQTAVMNKGRENSSTKVVDTLTYEEAQKFFPNGFPSEFNYNTQPIPDNWAELRLQELEEEEKRKNQISVQQTPGFQASHRAKLLKDFYSGNDMINKEFEMAVHEKNSRDIARAVGSTFKESEKAAGKIVNRRLSNDEVDRIPTHEHAKPLLSVMYQSLTNNPSITPDPRLPQDDGPVGRDSSR
ncbi:hypothetical protein F4804DRAFT_102050 [Jackrogersella minutella]|nr:hypothetical protein F4804DRAFT_102050 [Jackrogersella minutella]